MEAWEYCKFPYKTQMTNTTKSANPAHFPWRKYDIGGFCNGILAGAVPYRFLGLKLCSFCTDFRAFRFHLQEELSKKLI